MEQQSWQMHTPLPKMVPSGTKSRQIWKTQDRGAYPCDLKGRKCPSNRRGSFLLFSPQQMQHQMDSPQDLSRQKRSVFWILPPQKKIKN
jgi:hypothetical protein